MTSNSKKLGIVAAVTEATHAGLPDYWNCYTSHDYSAGNYLRTPAGALTRRMRPDEKDAAAMAFWERRPEFAPRRFLI